MTIEEAKDLATLPLDELIGNLKVYGMVLDNDGVGSKTTKEKVKSLAHKAKVTKEQTSDDSDSQGERDEDIDEEEAEAFSLLARNFHGERSKKKGACYNYGKEGHFPSECQKSKENKAFIGGLWSNGEDEDEQLNDTTCLMAIDSQEVCLKCDLLPNDWIVDSGCTKHMTANRRLFTSYKDDGGHVVFGSNLKGKVVGGGNITHDFITITNVEHVSGLAFNLINIGHQGSANIRTRKEVSTMRVLELLHLDLFGPSSIQSYRGYSQTSKACTVLNKKTMRIEKSLNVTFDESLPEPKSSSSVEDDRIDEPIVQDLNVSSSLQVNVSDKGYPKSLKEARGHAIEQVIGELNERTLRSKTKQT
ncbi:zf-CCHC domain-containing protein [Tanacetum coccineum]